VDIYFDYAVIAGGGITRLYHPYVTNSNTTNGSLLALAFEAGIVIQNIEFSMFHPFLITDRRFRRALFSGTLLTKMKFVDTRGREFLSPPIRDALRNNEHHSVFPQMTREFYLQSLRGKVFAIPECSDEWFAQYQKTNEYGFLFKGHTPRTIGRLEIHPAFHFLIGGIAINERAETSMSNIYAAGEICGGLYGASRFGGTAVSEAWVFGKVAAHEINKRSRGRETTLAHTSPYRLIERVGSLGIRKSVTLRVWKALGPVRDKGTLTSFVAFLNQQQRLSSEEKLIQRMAEVSLARRSSVGGFFRKDLPQEQTGYNSYCTKDTFVFKK
jgi:aspartate oxidase